MLNVTDQTRGGPETDYEIRYLRNGHLEYVTELTITGDSRRDDAAQTFTEIMEAQGIKIKILHVNTLRYRRHGRRQP